MTSVVGHELLSGSSATPAAADNQTSEVSAVSQYILQDVEVLAVAQQIEGETPPATAVGQVAQAVAPNQNQQAPKQPAQPQPGARTVTLSVAPEDAQRLVLAEDKGHIRLVLRAYGDGTTLKLQDGGLFTTVNGNAVLKTDMKPLSGAKATGI